MVGCGEFVAATTGAVTMSSGGAINLQDGVIGTLHVGGLTVNGGTLSFDIGAGSSSNLDLIASSGTLTIGGAATITIGYVSGTPTLTNGTYSLITYNNGGSALGSTPFGDLTLNTSALSGSGKTFTLVNNAGNLELNVATTVTNGMYTLTTTPASLNVHVSGTTTVATVIANTGTGTQDALNYSALASSVSTGGSSGSVGTASGTTSGSNLAQGTNNSPGASQTFTATSTAGNVTLTNSSTVSNVTAAGTPGATNNGATINVYSGLSTWTTNGGGTWGTLATSFGTNWGTNQGSPGVTSGFLNTDTATFGSALTSGTGTVTLDGASPSLKAITFNNSNHSYTIAQGTGGTLMLNGSPATITDSAGSHTISAPVELDSAAATTVSNSGDTLTISGLVSQSGTQTFGVNGPGSTVLSNSGNTFSGAVSVNSGTLAFSAGNASATAAQSLGENASLNLGVASTSSGILDYTGGTGTLAKNINALGNGTDAVENTGSGLLTLSGTLTKNGTKLTLNGGSNGISVSGQVTGSNSGSDLIVTGGTTTLTNTSNNYNGPTYVQGGGTLVDNTTGAGAALPNGTTLYVGGTDNTTGAFDLGGNNQTVAGLNSQGTGGSSNVVLNNGTVGSTLTVSGGGTFAGLIKNGASNTGFAVTGGTMTVTNSNTYSGGTTVSGGTLYVQNTSGSGTGTDGVNVSSGATLAGNGIIAPTTHTFATGVVLNSGSNLASGNLTAISGTPNTTGTGAGTGLTLNNSANLSSILSVNSASLTFALGSGSNGLVSNPSGGAYNFGNPDTDTTYLNVVGNAAGEINFTGANAVNLVDLTTGGLTLRAPTFTPYLLIQTGTGTAFSGLDSNFSGLVTELNGVLSLDQNGYVVGVWAGGSNPLSDYTAISINQSGPDGVTPLTAGTTAYPVPVLYLQNGDLEVVPEPGTWALILGGLALLIFIQRQKSSKNA